jgi:hypothetical protein
MKEYAKDAAIQGPAVADGSAAMAIRGVVLRSSHPPIGLTLSSSVVLPRRQSIADAVTPDRRHDGQ